MDLTVEPVLGSTQFLLDPEARTSLDELENYLTHRAAYDIAVEMAAAEKVEYFVFVKRLTKDDKDAIQERALDRAIGTITKLRGLADRVSGSVAYKIMRKRVHEKLGEHDGFLSYLQKRLEEDPGEKTLEELVFFLEVIEFYEKLSKERNFSHDIFSDPLTYGKMLRAAPELRKRFRAVTNAKALLADHEQEIDARLRSLRSARSDALFRSEDTTPYDDQITVARRELDEVREKSAEPIANLETVFVAYAQAAVDIAKSPIHRDVVADSLPKVAEIKLKGMGFDPAEISPEFKGDRVSKPVAYTIHGESDVLITLKIKSRFYKIVQGLLEGTFDIRLSTIEEGRKLLDGFTNPRKRK